MLKFSIFNSQLLFVPLSFTRKYSRSKIKIKKFLFYFVFCSLIRTFALSLRQCNDNY